MLVKMRALAAGPGGVLLPGQTYDRADGADLVAAGAAEAVAMQRPSDRAEEPGEVAAELAPAAEIEHAVASQARKGRRR